MQLKENQQIIKSPLNFTGGKYKLLPQLLPLFPDDIDTFVDLFCGGCNVALNVTAKKIICNDKESQLLGLLEYLKDTSYTKLIDSIITIINTYNLSVSSKNGYEYYGCDSSKGLGSYNKERFMKLRKHFNTLLPTDENYYPELYTLVVFGFNNQIRFNSNGKYNLPVGKRDFNLRMMGKLYSFTENSSKLIFLNKDFAEISIARLSSKDFVYADPPYLITCATYNENSWDENEEKRLLSYLDELNDNKIRFALSNVLSTDGKTNDILKQWLDEKGYNCNHLDFSYKNSNYHKKNISKTDEVLITNY